MNVRRVAMEPLSPVSVTRVDRSGMVELILAQGAHLADAMRRVSMADLPQDDRSGGLVVCGMGGSAIGADLACAVLLQRARRPIRTVRDYALDTWVAKDTLVVCASYSGNTEETLACYAEAKARDMPRVVITTGGKLGHLARADGIPVIQLPAGMQPRASVAYMLVSVLACAEACGAIQGIRSEIERAEVPLTRLAQELGPAAPAKSFAKALAVSLRGTVPVIYGAGATSAVAVRWKAQLNENAGVHAFASTLPEADHNEICAWDSEPLAPLSAVFLGDRLLDARLRRRMQLTALSVRSTASKIEFAEGRGATPLERVLSLVLIGDLVSVYLAVLESADPTPVAAIERFKVALA
ncbi:MAG: glucose/mannose-6-phosphate isomerase [Thermoleophilaceae bacterium]|nr:glucose/mannose-6-phosphate isomerase [Thermoleophilaceae bacterium]